MTPPSLMVEIVIGKCMRILAKVGIRNIPANFGRITLLSVHITLNLVLALFSKPCFEIFRL